LALPKGPKSVSFAAVAVYFIVRGAEGLVCLNGPALLGPRAAHVGVKEISLPDVVNVPDSRVGYSSGVLPTTWS
jgi:hypothetical protein